MFALFEQRVAALDGALAGAPSRATLQQALQELRDDLHASIQVGGSERRADVRGILRCLTGLEGLLCAHPSAKPSQPPLHVGQGTAFRGGPPRGLRAEARVRCVARCNTGLAGGRAGDSGAAHRVRGRRGQKLPPPSQLPLPCLSLYRILSNSHAPLCAQVSGVAIRCDQNRDEIQALFGVLAAVPGLQVPPDRASAPPPPAAGSAGARLHTRLLRSVA